MFRAPDHLPASYLAKLARPAALALAAASCGAAAAEGSAEAPAAELDPPADAAPPPSDAPAEAFAFGAPMRVKDGAVGVLTVWDAGGWKTCRTCAPARPGAVP